MAWQFLKAGLRKVEDWGTTLLLFQDVMAVASYAHVLLVILVFGPGRLAVDAVVGRARHRA